MAEQSVAAAASPAKGDPLIRFGTFQLDQATGELTRNGKRVALQDQPARALCLLASKPGQLVSRDELRLALWPADTFVDFDTALNIIVGKVRHALGDAAGSPRFIETVPKRGYRFIADVHQAGQEPLATMPEGGGDAGRADGRVPDVGVPGAARRATAWRTLVGIGLILGLIVAGRQLLRRPDAGVPLPRSIAVLPFKPLVASDIDERMQLGMSEALINRLSRIQTLRVEPLPRVRRYSGLDQDPRQAGRELGVDAVVEGYFQQSHGTVHVRARLLRTADGTALAANEWRGSFSDIFEIQKAVAQSVTSALELMLTPAEHARVTKPDTTSAEAYRHYLFGRHLLEIREVEQQRAAETEFREAVRLDPGYAAAHAALSIALANQVWPQRASGIEVMGPAKEAALKAIAIDGGHALGHSALARVHDFFDLDPVRGQREHVRAMELSPQEPLVLRGYWYFLLSRNALDEALELNTRELALDPTSPLANRNRAMTLFVARRYDDCVAQGRRTIALDPRDLVLSHNWMAMCLEYQGKQGESVEMWERGRELRGNARVAEQLKRVYRERGWAAYWRERVRTAGHEAAPVQDHVRVGNLDDAFRGLERLLERRNPNLSTLHYPYYDPLRPDPRFQALLRRAGYSDEMNALLKASRPPLPPARVNDSTRP
jgi:DNA-binding winged helix-turn-helix (wHTH) protein/TolB-like protein